jgi:hypothetical protein
MKKNFVRIIALVVASVMICAAFAACSGAKKPSGTYKLFSVNGTPVVEQITAVAAENGMTLKQYAEAKGFSEDDVPSVMIVTFNEDSTARFVSILDEVDEKCTWLMDGDKIKIKDSEGNYEYMEFDGEKITLKNDNGTFVFSK